MICLFCGKENEDNALKCKYCGFYFEKPTEAPLYRDREEAALKSDTEETVQPQGNYVTDSTKTMPVDKHNDNADYKENNSPVEKAIPQAETSYKSDPEEQQYEAHKLSSLELFELIVALVLGAAAVTLLVIGIIMSWGSNVIIDPIYVLGIGIIGAIAFAYCCKECEGVPDTLVGLILKPILLMLIWEGSYYTITIPLVIILYGYSIYHVIKTYRGNLPFLVMGIVATTFLPFLGAFIILIIIAIFFAFFGGGRGSKKGSITIVR